MHAVEIFYHWLVYLLQQDRLGKRIMKQIWIQKLLSSWKNSYVEWTEVWGKGRSRFATIPHSETSLIEYTVLSSFIKVGRYEVILSSFCKPILKFELSFKGFMNHIFVSSCQMSSRSGVLSKMRSMSALLVPVVGKFIPRKSSFNSITVFAF